MNGFMQKAGPAAHKAEEARAEAERQRQEDYLKALSAPAEAIWRLRDGHKHGTE